MYQEDYDNAGAQERNGDDIYSKPVRAGKRTYFFDVKATKNNDYYLTITESKRRVDKDGHFAYDKHKIFLYKEDFEKFADGLDEVVKYIKEKCPVQERVYTEHADHAEQPAAEADKEAIVAAAESAANSPAKDADVKADAKTETKPKDFTSVDFDKL